MAEELAELANLHIEPADFPPPPPDVPAPVNEQNDDEQEHHEEERRRRRQRRVENEHEHRRERRHPGFLLEPGRRDVYSAILIFVPAILHEAVLKYLSNGRLWLTKYLFFIRLRTKTELRCIFSTYDTR